MPTNRADAAPSFEAAKEELKSAQRALKAAILRVKDLRRNHLLERAGIAVSLDRNKDVRADKRILHAEARKEMFNRLRRIMRGEKSGTLSHIQDR